MVLLEVERGVIDQELPDPAVPVGEDQPAHVPLAGEVEAVVVVAGRLAVEEIKAGVVEAASRVVVDDVEQNGDPVDVEDIDQRLQLVDLAVERARREGGTTATLKELVDQGEIAVQPRPGRDRTYSISGEK